MENQDDINIYIEYMANILNRIRIEQEIRNNNIITNIENENNNNNENENNN